jgi:hypothetical protein
MNFIGFHSKTTSTGLLRFALLDQRSFLWIALSILLVAFSGVLAGCSSNNTPDEHSFSMAPMHEMPADVQSAPVAVQQAYQFSAANPEVLQQLPCYCGCGAVGHKSNYACYISGVDESGAATFDAHALGCSICVDITQDAMRLLDQGKSVPEIRAYVDETYAKFGPSNMP